MQKKKHSLDARCLSYCKRFPTAQKVLITTTNKVADSHTDRSWELLRIEGTFINFRDMREKYRPLSSNVPHSWREFRNRFKHSKQSDSSNYRVKGELRRTWKQTNDFWSSGMWGKLYVRAWKPNIGHINTQCTSFRSLWQRMSLTENLKKGKQKRSK